MSFNAVCENKILAKISGFTVYRSLVLSSSAIDSPRKRDLVLLLKSDSCFYVCVFVCFLIYLPLCWEKQIKRNKQN